MKADIVLIEKEKTVKELLVELDLNPELMVVSVNDKMVDLDTVLLPQQQVRIFPIISGGEDSSLFILDYGNKIEIDGDTFTEAEEEKQKRDDELAIKLARYQFIAELKPYALKGYDVEELLRSTRCMRCKKKLHLPGAWQHLPMKQRRQYFKAIVKLGQKEILMCCSCYSTVTNLVK